MDEFIGDARDRLWAGGGASGVKDKLPLALVEEEADREIATEERRENGDGERFQQPCGIDRFELRGLLLANVWFRRGARHE